MTPRPNFTNSLRCCRAEITFFVTNPRDFIFFMRKLREVLHEENSPDPDSVDVGYEFLRVLDRLPDPGAGGPDVGQPVDRGEGTGGTCRPGRVAMVRGPFPMFGEDIGGPFPSLEEAGLQVP